MKRLIAMLIPMLLVTSICTAQTNGASSTERSSSSRIDLSGMSYQELVELKDQINLAMWKSDVWEEVEVPAGLWKIGVDIPEDHYTIYPSEGNYATIQYGNKLDESGAKLSFLGTSLVDAIYSPTSLIFSSGMKESIDIDMKAGYYVQIDGYSVVFTPYSGKPVLGFKKLLSGFTIPSSTPSPTSRITGSNSIVKAPSTTPVISDSGSKYNYYDYDTVSRNPEKYKWSKACLQGKVVQVIGSRSAGYSLRFATSGSYDDLYYISIPASKAPDYNILEGDKLTILCTLQGEYTYETVLGSQITLPYAVADSVSLDN